jgi:hypothetical protein
LNQISGEHFRVSFTSFGSDTQSGTVLDVSFAVVPATSTAGPKAEERWRQARRRPAQQGFGSRKNGTLQGLSLAG